MMDSTRLPDIHKDPFDRLLIVLANRLQTRLEAIRLSPDMTPKPNLLLPQDLRGRQKIGWWDGCQALWCILRYNLF